MLRVGLLLLATLLSIGCVTYENKKLKTIDAPYASNHGTDQSYSDWYLDNIID